MAFFVEKKSIKNSITDYQLKLRINNYQLRVINYELSITDYQLRITD